MKSLLRKDVVVGTFCVSDEMFQNGNTAFTLHTIYELRSHLSNQIWIFT